MTADTIGHWSILELVWTALALVGVGFSVANVREAARHLLDLGGIVNGRRRIAIGDLRRETVRLLIYAACIAIGLFAGNEPPPTVVTETGWAVALALLAVEVLQVSQSILDRLDSNYLMRNGLQARDSRGKFTKGDQ